MGQLRVVHQGLENRPKVGIGELLRAQAFRGQIHKVPELNEEEKELPLGAQVNGPAGIRCPESGPGPYSWDGPRTPPSPFSISAFEGFPPNPGPFGHLRHVDVPKSRVLRGPEGGEKTVHGPPGPFDGGEVVPFLQDLELPVQNIHGLAQVLPNPLRAFLPDDGVGILPRREGHHGRVEAGGQKHVSGPEGGFQAGRITVEEEEDPGTVAGQERAWSSVMEVPRGATTFSIPPAARETASIYPSTTRAPSSRRMAFFAQESP